MAHELGHNFGLVPTGAPYNGDSGGHSANHNYLMASGLWRDVPNTLADVAPNGAGLDLIPQEQIDLALQSSLLHDADLGEVPEPASLALVGAGLLVVASIRRRRRD